MAPRTLKTAFILLLAAPAFVLAKGRKPVPPANPTQTRNERLLQLINVNIQLTPEQSAAIKAAFDEDDKKSAELKADYDAKRAALDQNADRAVSSVLSDEQKVMYERAKEALRNEEQKRDRRRERLNWEADHPDHSLDGGAEDRSRDPRRGR